MTVTRDPYEVLGVPRTASTRQIRAAYVARARVAHPDIVGGRGLDRMRMLNEAWEVLKDNVRRSAWDAANFPERVQVEANGAATVREDRARPFWYGAHGPPPGRPWGTVLDFGIFEGWSLGEITRRDRGYLVWLQDRPEARAFRHEIAQLLDRDGEQPADARDRRR